MVGARISIPISPSNLAHADTAFMDISYLYTLTRHPWEPAARCHLARARRAAMALSKLSGDEQGIVSASCATFSVRASAVAVEQHQQRAADGDGGAAAAAAG